MHLGVNPIAYARVVFREYEHLQRLLPPVEVQIDNVGGGHHCDVAIHELRYALREG